MDSQPPRRPLWQRILKWVLISAAAIIILVLAALTVAVSYLSPERLTPIVAEQANEYLDADVKVGRVELSFWSTFPRFEVDVRDLSVISHSLDRLPADAKAQLPAWADSLLSIKQFNAAINIPELTIGRIALYDIIIDSPRINLVSVNAESANYNVVAPSPQTAPTTPDEPVSIPDFSFGKFEIIGNMPVRYLSLPDSTDIAVMLTTTRLQGEDAPAYNLAVDGRSSARLGVFEINDLRFGIGGKIKWDHKEPAIFTLDKFKTGIGEVTTVTSAKIDMTDVLTVETLDFELPMTRLDAITALIPENMRGELGKVTTDMSVAASFRLTAPFRPGTDSIPSAAVTLRIPEATASYDNLKLSRLALEADATIDGKNPDRSVLNIDNLVMIGEGVGFSLDAKISTPLSDPAVEGSFKGGISMSRLPRILTDSLPFTLRGELRADSRFALCRSYLSRKGFHRIRLTGEATLKNFNMAMRDASATVYTRHAELKLGTDNSFTRGKIKADSLLTVAFSVDTLSVFTPGMEIAGREWKAGIGCLNTASGADTTVINPIGGRISGKLLTLRSEDDSTRVRLRDITMGASLHRYNGNARLPQLHLDIYAGRAMYGDRLNRASLSKAFMGITMHPAPPRIGKRMKARIDSISAARPDLSPDSVYAEARRIARANRRPRPDSVQSTRQGESLDIELDNSIKQLLRRWNARGVLKAERARVFTPYFPVRNMISDLDMQFSTDSITITDTRYRMGKSDFLINGTIGNISRALTSRRNNALDIFFDLQSDTVDVNQIAAAVFAGAAFSDRAAKNNVVIPDTDDDAAMQRAVEKAADPDSAAALVVPMNIDALLNINARNVLYSDLVLHDLTGSLMVLDGAINLHALRARTEVGSMDLSALYSAPDKKDLRFAFGLKIKDFYIDRFTRLIPAVDSLMPLLNDIRGIINADIAATSRIDSMMNLDIPSLSAAIKISGDSLVLMDAETFRTVSKWLLFKDKKHNMIDSMNVEMIVKDSRLEMFPFMFNIDRYKLGVMGNNDMALNFNYHVAVLKSPLPFRFGINLSGNMDKFKVRLGKAKFNEKSAGLTMAIADTTRINLVNRIENIFRRGVRDAGVETLQLGTTLPPVLPPDNELGDTISHADSLIFINEGLLPPPPAPDSTAVAPAENKKSKKGKKK